MEFAYYTPTLAGLELLKANPKCEPGDLMQNWLDQARIFIRQSSRADFSVPVYFDHMTDLLMLWFADDAPSIDPSPILAVRTQLKAVRYQSECFGGQQPQRGLEVTLRKARIVLQQAHMLTLEKHRQLHRQGPDEPNKFWWQSVEYGLKMEPRVWKLFCYVWDKSSVKVSDIGKDVWKNRDMKYTEMKHTVKRMNETLDEARVPMVFSKSRNTDTIVRNLTQQRTE